MPATADPPHPASPGLLLGIDTGGTFTDAVVYDETHGRIVATAKSPTTHHDLSIGISGAIDAALAASAVQPSSIELVSLSTTLATNALVEGKGRHVAAIIIGFDEAVIERNGLAEALAGDPAIFLPGGHDPHGSQVDALDLDELERRVREIGGGVDGFAVMAQFSVRNPEHELAAAELVRRVTGKPVTMSHVLSAKLNGPKRAVTAILNARLIPIVEDLVETTSRTLVDRGIAAPLMVVRGDGSLVSAEFVRARPIETILSGPAASLVGAAHLTGLTDAIISDIGGTTTDIAVLRGGVPLVSHEGATVGGHRTMVSAVAMHTHGLGGDSEVRHDDRSQGAVLTVGPRRVIPISLLATRHPEAVHSALDQQRRAELPGELDGAFVVVPDRDRALTSLEGTELELVASIEGEVAAASSVLGTLVRRRIAERLVRRGVLQWSSFTPSDASHVLGRQRTYDTDAARIAAELFARRRDRLGKPIASGADEISTLTIATLERRSAEAVLAAAFDHDGLPADTVRSRPVQTALDGGLSVVRLQVGLDLPLVALGASASSYYPSVARLLGTDAVVPQHAGVANAVGAVVGRVRISHVCSISAPQQGEYVVHAGERPERFTDLDAARARATEVLRARLAADMAAAGAPEYEVASDWREVTVEVGGMPMFVDGALTVTGSGRPHAGD